MGLATFFISGSFTIILSESFKLDGLYRTPVDGPSSGRSRESGRFFLKWAFLSHTGRSFEPEWTIMGRSGRLFDLKWTVRMNQRIKVYCPKIWVRSKVDGLGSKWTAPSGRSAWNTKVDGPKGNDCTIWSIESGRSQEIKVDGQKVWKWTVLKNQSEQSKRHKLDGLKDWNWTVQRSESFTVKLDGLKESMWTVPRPKNGRSKGMKLDGHTGTVPLVKLVFGWY